MDWTLFFPSGARVLALPDWRSPRLYLSTKSPFQIWRHSAFYPASRLNARLFRFALRLGAAAGMARARTVRASGWPLGEFAREALPRLAFVVVLAAPPGSAQRMTAQLRDAEGRVLGYVKYATDEASRRKLRHEWSVLSSLPGKAGPTPVKFGSLGNGEALLQRPLSGKPPPITLPPPEDVIRLLDSFAVLPPMPLEAHPWVRRMRERGTSELETWLEPLAGRNWPVVLQHGDFAPWNMLREPDGTLRAIDWEYGVLKGFPHLDLAYYILQISALIYRRDPLEAASYATRYLSEQPALELSKTESRALVRLAAYDAYQKFSEDGRPSDNGLQTWRRTVWASGLPERSLPSQSERASHYKWAAWPMRRHNPANNITPQKTVRQPKGTGW